MSYAQFPIEWLSTTLDAKTNIKKYALADLHWRDHRAAGIAALLILIVLATRLNEQARAARKARQHVSDTVAVTWTELQRLTGHARATVGKGLMLLEGWGAIKLKREGRTNRYQLINVHVAGKYCALPVTFLESNGDPVSRFRNLPPTQIGLNALKLYIVLLALRSTQYGTTSISFNGITRWTGIRREDIRKAWAYLDGQQLAVVSTLRDPRHHKLGDNDQSQRYAIIGLTRGYTKEDVDFERARNQEDERNYRPGMPVPPPPDDESRIESDRESYERFM